MPLLVSVQEITAIGAELMVIARSHPASGAHVFAARPICCRVTDPTVPRLLWEFNDPGLGYATSGPAIVRVGNSQKNGKWFAVFGSGPTGPIDKATNQFLGRSNQTLKFFVVDLLSGTLIKTIDTGIEYAFSSTLVGGSIDTDRWNPGVAGNYQDDAIYAGYVKKSASGTWTDGGVVRILTKESIDPNDSANPWVWSTVIDGIGPVTSSIARIQDKNSRNLWLYFGTGRYFFRDGISVDDSDGVRSLYGVKDPCYNKNNIGNYLSKDCSEADKVSRALVNQSTTITPSLSSADPGWIINLDSATSGKVCSTTTSQACTGDYDCNAGETCQKYEAERVVTDTVALTNGTVFFTSFKPILDACGYGGNSYLWAINYNTGGQAAENALQGKALVQLSTGEFKEIDLSKVFTDSSKGYRRMLPPMIGKSPSEAPPIISSSQNRPLKKILHIRER